MVRFILVVGPMFMVQSANGPKTPASEGASLNSSPEPERPREGIWPTRKLMNLMLNRWSDELSAQFELTEKQRAEVRERVPRQWSQFLKDHRAEIQPLVNEYLEIHMEEEPPTADQVQDWAGRALPVFEEMRTQFEEGIGEFRRVIEPSQKAKFDAKALQLKLGLRVAGQQLQKWKDGEIDPKGFWTPPSTRPSESRPEAPWSSANLADSSAARPPAPPKPDKDTIDSELESWDRFVADFASQHRFNLGQVTAAQSCLRELKERARDHRDHFRDEILALEKEIRNNKGTEAELADIKGKLVRLYGPVDAMFAELKNRVEQIATSDQRSPEAPADVE